MTESRPERIGFISPEESHTVEDARSRTLYFLAVTVPEMDCTTDAYVGHFFVRVEE
jgi:hypothetical protein